MTQPSASELLREAGHRCDPPCELDRMADHAAKRKRMTKAELLTDAALFDEAWINQATELDMANAYIEGLRAVEVAARALDRVATWSALGRPDEVEAFRKALASDDIGGAA